MRAGGRTPKVFAWGTWICRPGTATGGALLLEAEVEEEEAAAVGRRRERLNLVVLFARGKGTLKLLFLEGTAAFGGPGAEDMALRGGEGGGVRGGRKKAQVGVESKVRREVRVGCLSRRIHADLPARNKTKHHRQLIVNCLLFHNRSPRPMDRFFSRQRTPATAP